MSVSETWNNFFQVYQVLKSEKIILDVSFSSNWLLRVNQSWWCTSLCQLSGSSTASMKSSMGLSLLLEYNPSCLKMPDPYAKACWTAGTVFRKPASSFALALCSSFMDPDGDFGLDEVVWLDGDTEAWQAQHAERMLCHTAPHIPVCLT